MKRVLSKQEFYRELSKLAESFEVIGPRERPNKGVFYEQIAEVSELYVGDRFTTRPVKEYFLEPCTRLLRYRREGLPGFEDVPEQDGRRIILGVRPCEARGLVLLDNVFDVPASPDAASSGAADGKRGYPDRPYIRNRERTVVVGLACKCPDGSCFCTSVGGSPAETVGMDAIVFETEDGFAIETFTAEGDDVFGSFGDHMTEAEESRLDSEKARMRDLPERKLRPPDNLVAIFSDDYWVDVSRPCIGCGVCTYLCPTCHCFDLVDEQRSRLRCYDGCSFPDFTLEASGENPRPTKKERYRQRVLHKFDYFRRNFGENLCVGCGRCIRFCPVRMDIADIVDKAPVPNRG